MVGSQMLLGLVVAPGKIWVANAPKLRAPYSPACDNFYKSKIVEFLHGKDSQFVQNIFKKSTHITFFNLFETNINIWELHVFWLSKYEVYSRNM